MSHWQSKTKIRRSDTLFSQYIRKRDKECVYKFKCFGHQDFKDLTCSHYIKRRHESVRFDPENCDAACRPCHQWVEDTVEGKDALRFFKIKQLAWKHNALLVRAHQYKKRDDKMDLLIAKELLKTL